MCELSCNKSDDEQIITEEPTVALPDVPDVPSSLNRGCNIHYALFIRLENENGENIFDELQTINDFLDFIKSSFGIYKN